MDNEIDLATMFESIHTAIREQAIQIQSLRNDYHLLNQKFNNLQNQIFLVEIKDDGTSY